ncbi:MAG: acyl carrier protein, partial [Limosilactobacillus fermentum]
MIKVRHHEEPFQLGPAQDLDVDSLGLLTIATQVEERFGVALDDSLIPTLPTVGALVD